MFERYRVDAIWQTYLPRAHQIIVQVQDRIRHIYTTLIVVNVGENYHGNLK